MNVVCCDIEEIKQPVCSSTIYMCACTSYQLSWCTELCAHELRIVIRFSIHLGTEEEWVCIREGELTNANLYLVFSNHTLSHN